VLDVRRGDVPKPASTTRMASLAATDRLIEASPGSPPPRSAHRQDPCSLERDSHSPRRRPQLFPPSEAELIAELIRPRPALLRHHDLQNLRDRDERLPRDLGILQGDVPYEQIVAPQLPSATRLIGGALLQAGYLS